MRSHNRNFKQAINQFSITSASHFNITMLTQMLTLNFSFAMSGKVNRGKSLWVKKKNELLNVIAIKIVYNKKCLILLLEKVIYFILEQGHQLGSIFIQTFSVRTRNKEQCLFIHLFLYDTCNDIYSKIFSFNFSGQILTRIFKIRIKTWCQPGIVCLASNFSQICF